VRNNALFLKANFFEGSGLKRKEVRFRFKFLLKFLPLIFLIPPKNTKQKLKQLEVPKLMFHHMYL